MEDKKTLGHKIASVISVVGNPLITLSIFTLYITLKLFDGVKAGWISFLVIGGVAIPVAVYNYSRVKKGHITNFDLSDRKERHLVYPRLIFMVGLVTAIFFLTQQPMGFCLGSLVFLSMLVVSYAVNYKLKISLHTSISFFMALTLFKFGISEGLFMLVFAFLISVSRLVLKRHTLAEVLAGGLAGIVFGLGNLFL